MTTLSILEHASANYKPRTIHNAVKADVTLAFAFDFLTAGEQLTKQAAGVLKYVPLDLHNRAVEVWAKKAGHFIWESDYCKGRKITVNIAGNGIYTLKKFGWGPANINKTVYWTLMHLIANYGIRFEKIVCGGQTGADLAGAVAGVALHLPVEVTMPHGFRYRAADGRDYNSTEETIRTMIMNGLPDCN
jgi:hypothetical protein